MPQMRQMPKNGESGWHEAGLRSNGQRGKQNTSKYQFCRNSGLVWNIPPESWMLQTDDLEWRCRCAGVSFTQRAPIAT